MILLDDQILGGVKCPVVHNGIVGIIRKGTTRLIILSKNCKVIEGQGTNWVANHSL